MKMTHERMQLIQDKLHEVSVLLSDDELYEKWVAHIESTQEHLIAVFDWQMEE